MVQNVSFSVNLCGMCLKSVLFKVIATWLLRLVQLSMHIVPYQDQVFRIHRFKISNLSCQITTNGY